MNFKQKIVNKVIEAERVKTLRAFAANPGVALGDLLTKCGIDFKMTGDNFIVTVSHAEEVVITIKKQRR